MSNNHWFSRISSTPPKKLRMSRFQSGMQDQETLDAIERKLQEPENRRFGKAGDFDQMAANTSFDQNYLLASKTARKIHDAKNIIRNLPDVGLGANIVVQAICNLGYQSREITFQSSHRQQLGVTDAAILDYLKEFFSSEHDIKTLVPKWVYRALISHGSNPILVLPESTIDQVINGSDTVAAGNEALYHQEVSPNSSLGIIGTGWAYPRSKVVSYNDAAKKLKNKGRRLNVAGIEDLRNISPVEDTRYCQEKLFFSATDNLDTLKSVLLRQKIGRIKMTEAYANRYAGFGGMVVGNESATDDANERFTTAIRNQRTGEVKLKKDYYAERTYAQQPFVQLRHPSTLEQTTVGHPSINDELPPECLIPISNPSTPNRHIAYWCILDENQIPLRITGNMLNAGAQIYANGMADNESNFIEQASQALDMNTSAVSNTEGRSILSYNEALELYINVMHNDLTTRIKNSKLGDGYMVAKPTEIYELMFTLALQKKRTQALFIPADLVTYFAYHFDDDGIGESLITAGKMISASRMNLLLSRTNAQWQASINRRNLTISPDPRDPDKPGTVRRILHNYFVNNSHVRMPMNSFDPTSTADAIFRQAIEVNVDVDSGYPNTKIQVTPIDYTAKEPDETLFEELRKLSAMQFSLTPDQVDGQLGDDRVTSLALRNDMFRERITGWQNDTNAHLSNHVRNVVLNSSILMDKIRSYISEAKKSGDGKSENPIDVAQMAINWVNGLTVHLPKVEDETPDDTEEAFGKFNQFVDEIVEKVLLNEEMIKNDSEFSGFEDIGKIKAMLKSSEAMRWLTERGAVPNLRKFYMGSPDVVELDGLVDSIVNGHKGMMPVLTRMAEKLRALNDAHNERVKPRGGRAEDDDGFGPEAEGGDPFGDGGLDTEFDDPAPDLPAEPEPDVEEESKPEGEDDEDSTSE